MGEVLELNTVDNIINSIYIIRGQQVMLDSDLAKIYGYEVKRLNEQVKRNIKRFPEDFMFQLTREEIDFVKSQFATSRITSLFEGQEGGRRKLPYVFTEQGIYMLATVLKGELAEQQSIFIMRAFRNAPLYQTEQAVCHTIGNESGYGKSIGIICSDGRCSRSAETNRKINGRDSKEH